MSDFEPTDLAADASPAAVLRGLRDALVARLEELPETRLSKLTRRHGWTLRHELAWLAAADAELSARLELAAGGATGAAGGSIEEPRWRRLRGEAMHAAQELRLHALRDHLAESGRAATASVERRGPLLATAAARAAIAAHDAAARRAAAILDEAIGS